MRHLNEEQLIEHYYDRQENAAEHLVQCGACRTEYENLSRMLAVVSESSVPERDEDYGRRVYERLRPRLQDQPRRHWLDFFTFPRLVTAGAMAGLLLAAFLAGRVWQRQVAGPTPAETAHYRDRILLVAVGEHLERSQMVLIELANASLPQKNNRTVDISAEQGWARDLVSANRFYRQTAIQSGEAGVANVLEELERVLLDVANSPSEIPAKEWEGIRKRIEDKGILFKVRVIGSEVRDRQYQNPPAAVSGAGSGKS